jgi:hypothetical protein
LRFPQPEVAVNLRPRVSQPVCPGFRRPSETRDQLFFLLKISFRQLRLCYFVAPSLTRGRVCNCLVHLLLGLARAATLGSKSRRTHDHISLSRLRLPQPGGSGSHIYIPQNRVAQLYTRACGQVPVFIFPRNRVAQLNFPGTGFPFCRLGYSNPCPHESAQYIHTELIYTARLDETNVEISLPLVDIILSISISLSGLKTLRYKSLFLLLTGYVAVLLGLCLMLMITHYGKVSHGLLHWNAKFLNT